MKNCVDCGHPLPGLNEVWTCPADLDAADKIAKLKAELAAANARIKELEETREAAGYTEIKQAWEKNKKDTLVD